VYASRKCSIEGEWEDMDLTSCTMHQYSDPVLITQATIAPANQSVVDIFKAFVSICRIITIF